jgi:Amt family ammonium transporter
LTKKSCLLIQGWLHIYGQIDFAGGTVVHISSGVSGLVAALIVGKRHDYGQFHLFSFSAPS